MQEFKTFAKIRGRNGKETIGFFVGTSFKVKNEDGVWTWITWKDFGGGADVILKWEE